MITYALIAFAIAALGGLVLASHVLRGKLAPWALSFLHAALGATGLLLLISVLLQGSSSQAVMIAFALLLIAALGGFFLASFHGRGHNLKRCASRSRKSPAISWTRTFLPACPRTP